MRLGFFYLFNQIILLFYYQMNPAESANW